MKEFRSFGVSLNITLVVATVVCVTDVVESFSAVSHRSAVVGDTLLTLYNIRRVLLLLCILIVLDVWNMQDGMLKG